MARNKKNKFIETAQKHLQKQNFDKALKEYLKAHDEDSKDVRVAQKLGELYYKTGNKKEAIKFYKLAGSIYSRDGFHQKAIAAYKHILDIDPNYNEIRLEIANLYRKLGLMAEATPQFKEVLKYYEEQGDRDKTLEVLRNLAELEPRSVNHRIKLAEMYLKGGQREQGYSEFKRASDELKSAGKWDELAKLYERLIKADPSNVDNITGYAEVLTEKGDFPNAVKFYEQALKYRPEDAEILGKLINCCTRAQEADKAVKYLKQQAGIHEKNGESGEASKCYQKVLKLHPGDEQAKSRLSELGVEKAAASASPKTAAKEKEDEEIEALPPDEEEEQEPVALEEEPAREETPAVEAQPEPPAQEAEAPAAPAPDTEEEKGDIPSEEQIPGLLTEADVYLRYGLLDKARQYVKRVLRAKPDKHEALFLDGLLYKEQGRVEDAVESMMMAVTSAKSSQDMEEARSYLEEILVLQPDNPQAKSKLEELNAGVEIDMGVEEEEEGEEADAEDEDTLTLEADEEEPVKGEEKEREQLELRDEDEEPFSFVEEAGDDELLLVEDEDEAPAQPEASAPADAAEEEPLFEVEDEEEAPAAETGTEAPPAPEPMLSVEEEEEEEAPVFETEEETVSETAQAQAEAPVFEEIEEEEEEEEVELEEMGPSAFDELAEEAAKPPEEETEQPAAAAKERDLDSVLDDEWEEEEELGEEVTQQAAEEYALGAEETPAKEPPLPLEAEDETPEYAQEQATPDASSPVDEFDQAIEEVETEPEEPAAQEVEEEMPVGASVSEDLGPEAMTEETAEEVSAPGTVSEEEEVGAPDIHAVADASDQAWGDAFMEEEQRPPAQETPRHELEGMDEEADQVFGDIFGEETGEQGAELFDLSGVLDEEEVSAETAQPDKAGDEVGEVLSSFRERVKEEYGEDAETHFNLGIAYKEMGLYKDAIESFKTAMKAGYSPSDALNMTGLCFMDLGEYEKAEKVFNEGLSLQRLQEHEVLGLRFDLGLALENQGRLSEALDSYMEVEAINPHFRDVSRNIQAVEEALEDKEEKAKPARSKISYI